MTGRGHARAALDSIPGWSACQCSVTRLTGGLTNDSFLVTCDTGRYVLRLAGQRDGDTARDFSIEQQVQAGAAERGIAPAVVYADAGRGLLLSEYLAGRAWQRADLEQSDNLTALAALLLQVHALPRCGVPFAATAAAADYVAQLAADTRADRLAVQCLQIVKGWTPAAATYCCHNDVVAANVIAGNGLRLIDWEYARDNDPYFDLASVIGWHDLQSREADCLLEAYAGGCDAARRERLHAVCRVFDAIQWLWLAVRQQHKPTLHFGARMQTVRDRLQNG